MRRLVQLLGLIAVTATLLPAAGAAAAPIAVTSTKNDGPGTLRTAIGLANSQAGPDSIQIEATGKIALENKLPEIEGNIAIVGPGPGSLTVGRAAEGALFRIFEFATGASGSLTGLTVSDGVSGAGAGILIRDGSLTLTRVAVVGNEAAEQEVAAATALGGGIFSEGSLTLRESVVRENRAVASEGSSQTAAAGGGIYARGGLTIERSTISGNAAKALGGGGAVVATGGGVFALDDVNAELSTISGNSALADGGVAPAADGGGLVMGAGGELTGLTVTGNAAAAAEAESANLRLGGDPVVRDTIVSDPQGDAESCSVKTPSSSGFNLDEDGSCGFGKSTDLSGVIAGLEPLADNGGPVPTHGLRAESAAIDRGSAFGSAIDQRGLPRPSDFPVISNTEGGDGSDIGAFELQAPAPVAGPVVVTEVPTDRRPPNTRIVRGPARVTFERTAKFRFASSEAQSSFQCRLDKKKWHRCTSPNRPSVRPGKHVFKVRAIDRFGNVDPTPARFGWQVKPLGG
jgi:hypothetical protein